jgi:hypothetical protein
MLDYVLVDHPNLSEKKQAYKFPNVSAEILSIGNNKVLDFFGIEDSNNDFPNFDSLFSPFFNKDGSIFYGEVNYTRAGYIQKIINNLINSKPGIFVPYIFKNKLFLSALIHHSYCKSIALILQNLTIMTQNNSAGNAQANPANGTEEKKEGATPAPVPATDFVKDTLEDRVSLFEQIIKVSISSSEKENEIDTNANLSNIIMFILTKEFNERLNFLQKFVENLDFIVLKFTSTFFNPLNNKLGNIFLVFLEILFKESDPDIVNLKFPVYKIENYAGLYFQVLQKRQEQSSKFVSKSQRTLSFSSEVIPVNIKMYKILEALLMIVKHYANYSYFDQSVFTQNKFETSIFQLMIDHPYNNILHNQVKKFLVSIVESNSEALQDLYFTNNEQFFIFLESVVLNRYNISANKKKIKKGFIGHLLSLISIILKNDLLLQKLSEKESWGTFMKDFYEDESEMEKIVLGDVDIKTDDSDQNAPVFYFSLEEIKKKYAEFLDLSDEIEPNEVDDRINSSEERIDGASEENRSADNEHTEQSNTPDLLQEIRDLDDHNPESAYVDFNYWKPEIDYNVDDLLNELNN